jgi:hypothetical protein
VLVRLGVMVPVTARDAEPAALLVTLDPLTASVFGSIIAGGCVFVVASCAAVVVGGVFIVALAGAVVMGGVFVVALDAAVAGDVLVGDAPGGGGVVADGGALVDDGWFEAVCLSLPFRTA